MKLNYVLTAVIASVIAIFLWEAVGLSNSTQSAENTDEPKSTLHSQYAGQEQRDIKALSEDDINGLLSGAGTPYGGIAKAGEPNAYPGPRHMLDAIAAQEIEVSPEQKREIEALYEQMREKAIQQGEDIVAVEKELDTAFADTTITEQQLQDLVEKSADLYAALRFTHLQYHLKMASLLTPEQIAEYNNLRGYTNGDPCQQVPEGHDPEMWKMHNGCA